MPGTPGSRRTPAWVYAASCGLGVLGVFVPAFWPELLGHWSGSRAAFVGAAAAAVIAHELLHALLAQKLAPGLVVGGLALVVLAVGSVPLGWCAFVANAAASGPDVYESMVSAADPPAARP